MTRHIRTQLLQVTALIMLACSISACAHVPQNLGVGRNEQNAVGPQYNTTHVYVAPGTLGAFTDSWKVTFGGTSTAVSLVNVTPTPSETKSQLILSPVGTLSVFEFQTPVPYPFGAERTGWLVRNIDDGVLAARASGAKVVVTPFPDPIGRDAVIQFPGGINTQIYWHTTPPSYPPLATLPENRVYVSDDAASEFLSSYLGFTGGAITADDRQVDAEEIGLPGQTYRRVRISSPFGETVAMVTDGHVPFPFGRETAGYRVEDLHVTLDKARAAGATVLWGPQRSAERDSAILQFPGGYIAEIHDTVPR